MTKQKKSRFVRGTLMYVQIMAMMHKKGCTGLDVAKKLGVSSRGVWTAMGMMHRAGMAYIQSWVVIGRRRVPKLRLGRGADAPWPGTGNPPKRLGSAKRNVSVFASLAAVWQLIGERPSTRQRLEADAGLAHYQVGHILTQLKRHGLLHIGDWQRRSGCGGTPYPMYSAGPGEDAPRPARLPREQIIERARLATRVRRAGKSAAQSLLRLQEVKATKVAPAFVDDPSIAGWQERQPVKRVVPAELAEPIGLVGPNSIFALRSAA